MWQRAWWPPFNTVHWVTNLRSVSIQTANLNSNFYYMHVPWYGVIFIVEFIKCLLRASIKNTKTLSLSLFDMRAWRDPLPPQIWRSITLTLLNASKPLLYMSSSCGQATWNFYLDIRTRKGLLIPKLERADSETEVKDVFMLKLS